MPHGGKRPGAGRPKGSSSKKKRPPGPAPVPPGPSGSPKEDDARRAGLVELIQSTPDAAGAYALASAVAVARGGLEAKDATAIGFLLRTFGELYERGAMMDEAKRLVEELNSGGGGGDPGDGDPDGAEAGRGHAPDAPTPDAVPGPAAGLSPPGPQG